MRIFTLDTGQVMLGVDAPCGFIPILMWSTWSEYVAFVQGMNEFVEEVYKRETVSHAVATHINSIKELDKI